MTDFGIQGVLVGVPRLELMSAMFVDFIRWMRSFDWLELTNEACMLKLL